MRLSAGNGGGSLVAAAHPCCLLLPPSMAQRPPSTARTNCPPHAAGVRRRPPPPSHAARRRRSPPAHTPANLTTTQGTNQPMNPSIKPAIILLIDPSRKERMNYPIKRSASTADHGEPHYNVHPIYCAYIHMYMYTAVLFSTGLLHIYVHIDNTIFLPFASLQTHPNFT